MSKTDQAKKNMVLFEKLTNYMLENPDSVKNLPKVASFVVFTLHDKELNASNKKLLDSLIEEGNKAIKAEETEDFQTPWKFTPVFA